MSLRSGLSPTKSGDAHHQSQDDAQPTCPICLAHIARLEERAVVNSCMHVFCRACLVRWLELKRSCPLCKRRVASYYYNITAEGEHHERVVPPSPPREPPGGNPLIDDPRYATTFPTSRWQSSAPSGSGRHRSNRYRRSDSTSNAEPRPYYHRVRSMLGAGRQSGDAQLGLEIADLSPRDLEVLWRRHVYSQGLYALPLEQQRRSGGAGGSWRRLEEWVQRELEALLHSEDISLLRSFAMGLASALLSTGGTASREAVGALQPFLHDRAEHFWHELRCFAASPFSMSTYDRLVKYSRARPEEQGGSSANGGWLEAEGFTLWHARHMSGRGTSVQPPGRLPSDEGTSLAERSDEDSEPAEPSRLRRSAGKKRPREEHRCRAVGLCLDCAEREAEEEEERWVSERARRPRRDDSARAERSRAPQREASAAAEQQPQLSSSEIARLASERLRALLGSTAQPAEPARDTAERREAESSEGMSQQQREDGRGEGIIDLCASSDDSDVEFVAQNTDRPPNKEMWIRRNRPPVPVRRRRSRDREKRERLSQMPQGLRERSRSLQAKYDD